MGTDRDRALARIVGGCRKQTRWGSADRPRVQTPAPPSETTPAGHYSAGTACRVRIDIAAFTVRSSKGGSDGRWHSRLQSRCS